MQDALLLSRADLERVLDFESVLAVLEEAFHADRMGEWDTPKRIAAHTKTGALLAMPCAGGSPPRLGAKLVTTFPGNGALGLPSVSGLYALFDPQTGQPQAVLDAAFLTLVRTAAVSALATRILAREDSLTLGLLGAGAQAEFHVRSIAMVRPIESVVVWARSEEKTRLMIARLQNREDLKQIRRWGVAATGGEAAACDVVVTATAASSPILQGRDLCEGSHLNAIGAHTRSAREIDSEAVTRASALAVETADTLAEAGDFQLAETEGEGVISRVQTLGALLDPAKPPPPRNPRAISVFKSCGVAFEDLTVAALAFRRASESSLGLRFGFDR